MRNTSVKEVVELLVEKKVVKQEVAELLLVENNSKESPLVQEEPTQLFYDLTELMGYKMFRIYNEKKQKTFYLLGRLEDFPYKCAFSGDAETSKVCLTEKLKLEEVVQLLVNKGIVSAQVAECLKRKSWFDESPLEELDGATFLFKELVALMGYRLIEERDFITHETVYRLADKDSK